VRRPSATSTTSRSLQGIECCCARTDSPTWRASALAEILRAQPESERACRALVDLALERGGKDNITVIVAEYRVG
jgi:hypothetical protein